MCFYTPGAPSMSRAKKCDTPVKNISTHCCTIIIIIILSAEIIRKFYLDLWRRGSSCTVPSLGTDQEENSRLPKEKIIMSKPVKEPFRGRCGLLLAWVYEVHWCKKRLVKSNFLEMGPWSDLNVVPTVGILRLLGNLEELKVLKVL